MYYKDLNQFEDWDTNQLALEKSLHGLSASVKNALNIVEKYHDQPRRVGKGNYNRHPLRVARILAEELRITDETAILIALCHDLGEWSDYDIADLKNEFGSAVYDGVSVLTWDQKGDWSDFVARSEKSNMPNLMAIKIADKLDNNRAIALSGSADEKQKAKEKTLQTLLPLVEKYHPEMKNACMDSIK